MVRNITIRVDNEEVVLAVDDNYFYLVQAIQRLTKEIEKARQT